MKPLPYTEFFKEGYEPTVKRDFSEYIIVDQNTGIVMGALMNSQFSLRLEVKKRQKRLGKTHNINNSTKKSYLPRRLAHKRHIQILLTLKKHSVKYVAEMFGISENTIYTLIHRIKHGYNEYYIYLRRYL